MDHDKPNKTQDNAAPTVPYLSVSTQGKLIVNLSTAPISKTLTPNDEESAIKGIEVSLDKNGHIVALTFTKQDIVLFKFAIRYALQKKLLYVRLLKGKHDCSIELDDFEDDIIVDFDGDDHVLGFAVINSDKYFSEEFLRKITADWMNLQCDNLPSSMFDLNKLSEPPEGSSGFLNVPDKVRSRNSSTGSSPFSSLNSSATSLDSFVVVNDDATSSSTSSTSSSSLNTENSMKKKRKKGRKKRAKVHSDFLSAVCQGLLDRAKNFFNEDNTVIHDVDSQGGNIVVLAAMHGKIEILDWVQAELLGKEFPRKFKPEQTFITLTSDNGGEGESTEDSDDGMTVEEKEIEKKRIRKLSEKKLKMTNKIVLNEFRRTDGGTPFIQAAAHGQLEAMEWLMKHDAANLSVNEANSCGDTALHHAAGGGHVHVLQWLLGHGAKITARTKSGSIALHRAATSGHLDAVIFLIDHGSPINDKTFRGGTPLHYAGRNNHIKVVEWLLINGAAHDLIDKDGNSILEIVQVTGNHDLISYVDLHVRKKKQPMPTSTAPLPDPETNINSTNLGQ